MNENVNHLMGLGVSAIEISKAQTYQSKFGGNLEKILVNMGSMSEDLLPNFYSLDTGLPIQPADITVNQTEEFNNLNSDFLISRGWIPWKFEDGVFHISTCSPYDAKVIEYLDQKSINFSVYICSQSIFNQLSNQFVDDAKNDTEEFSLSANEEDKLREMASEAPTVNLLNSLIAKGLKFGASDMHIEPVDGRYRVRYRIDGVLHHDEQLPIRLQLPILSRIKILSGMDIAERRRPQDGKIELKIANTELDIRVSSLPLNFGESVVMRFLKKDSVSYDFSVLNLSADVEKAIFSDLQRTSGVILLTGPTGSGKTTTLYTFLNELNDDDVKIITLEDPVEYQLKGLSQVQVRPEIDFDFSKGLRSIVRQDPDVIMVGEIRDGETARIAMQAALTGHLVFSTVHTNDAPSAFTRLLDLGVQEYLLNAALVSIIAQRLARKLCEKCSTSAESVDEVVKKYQLDVLAAKYDVTSLNLKQANGCSHCSGTGYKGRFAIIEYMRCDETIEAIPKDENFLINARKSNADSGFRTLLEDGLLRALKGDTTIDEVIRVCG